ncbi:MAG TPA: hypothetical protein PLZ79_12280 [Burkholderiales bacterium]|nr:hypothetical protein [Betaproteobacteria bacterium]HQR54040.1 hypothetical protein [Burkholderiales bacterium]
MPLDSKPKYPSRRAYVLKMRGDARAGALAGRLENLVTGRSREFTSGHELLDSLAGDLEANSGEPSIDANGSDRLEGSDEP